jgi:hypothetical protein
MLWWCGSPMGRAFWGALGLVMLFVGFTMTSIAGIVVMMIGLVATVFAAAPPAPIVSRAALRPSLVLPTPPPARRRG